MAVRMSQMLRTSRDIRRPVARAGPAAVPQRPPTPRPTPADDIPPLTVEAPPPSPAPAMASLGVDPEDLLSNRGDADSPQPAAAAYLRLVAVAESIFAAAAAKTTPEEAQIIGALRETRELLSQNDRLLTETVRQRGATLTWPRRAANTAILAVRLGVEIGYDERRSLAVGLCGLMHDLGMLSVPQDVLDSPRLTTEQLQLLRQHTVESQKIITAFGEAFAWIGKIVVQVHERFDGSGYPLGLEGERIHEMARILGIVDTYEAMAHPRADRQGRATYHALKEIIDLRNTLFERRLIKALIHIVSIFPLGSLVKLNNGVVGRVIGTSRVHPTRPIIEMALDARGHCLDVPQELNLEDEPMLYIVDPAIEESVLEETGGSSAG